MGSPSLILVRGHRLFSTRGCEQRLGQLEQPVRIDRSDQVSTAEPAGFGFVNRVRIGTSQDRWCVRVFVTQEPHEVETVVGTKLDIRDEKVGAKRREQGVGLVERNRIGDLVPGILKNRSEGGEVRGAVADHEYNVPTASACHTTRGHTAVIQGGGHRRSSRQNLTERAAEDLRGADFSWAAQSGDRGTGGYPAMRCDDGISPRSTKRRRAGTRLQLLRA